MSKSFVAVAGATGQLGRLIATNLRARNVLVKALVRPGTAPSRTEGLRDAGVILTEADLSDVPSLTKELQGASCVVSALNGLADTVLGTQKALLDAAVAAKVPRFIPSDFSLDFTKTAPGSNRNLDLRREFHQRLDESGIQWTSVLNGAFMELLDGQAPLINHSLGRVLYLNSDEQKLDFTTIADTAAYTAAVVADANPTPRYLRIAGDVVSAKDLAAIVNRVRGTPYSTLWVGSAGFLEGTSKFMKRFSIGGSEQDVFPAWQGMQYMANMFSGAGKLEQLDNERYPDLKWTGVEEFLTQHAS
ncbi:putative pinoresinol-lariciresinol reductase 3 [Cytospora mali]|uniref:Pinoresinol-lariciresinol reductase 3 n=1 Tax=Cytospora mali TaxID=578113 RepID=A0A194W003_CYTMA|nr:putative pinoresinol-lariciresinol reductase 3 [Valsa mali]